MALAEPVEQVARGTAPAAGDEPPVEAVPVPSPAPKPVLTPAPGELFPVAAERYADSLTEGQVPASFRIRRELKVGQPRAARIRTYLGQLAQA